MTLRITNPWRSGVFAAALTFAFGAPAVTTPGNAQAEDLPRSMTWSAYDVGSSGYVEASAVADALMREHDVAHPQSCPPARPSGVFCLCARNASSSAGSPTRSISPTEALYEFASQEWGPQDLRVLIGRPASFGIGVAGDAGVTDLEDLRGKTRRPGAGQPLRQRQGRGHQWRWRI